VYRKTIVLGSVAGFASISLGLVLTQKVIHVGDTTAAGLRVPTGQDVNPAGKTLTVSGRPIDIVLTKDQKTAFVLDNRGVTVLDVSGFKVLQSVNAPGGISMHGIALSPDEKSLAVSGNGNQVYVGNIANRNITWKGSVNFASGGSIGGAGYPCGLAFRSDGTKLYACLSRWNVLAEIDTKSLQVLRQIPTNPAPFDVLLQGQTALVSCWSRAVRSGEATAQASGTPVPIDDRGIVTQAAICTINLTNGTLAKSVGIGRQPSSFCLAGTKTLIPSANEDLLYDVSSGVPTPVFDATSVSGAMTAPTYAASNSDGSKVALALGGANGLAILKSKTGGGYSLDHTVKTAWYPTSVARAGAGWLVACPKGYGSRTASSAQKGWNVYQFQGTISWIPDTATGRLESVNPRLAPKVAPGIKRVIYILKENRTYDQILGDASKGDGNATLCDYPIKVTPNHHKLASQFVLLDNFYCNGVLSADGHAWAMEGNATSYFERTFGGWTRSYPYGDDPLSPSSTGFIWNNAIAHGRTFKNFGEFDNGVPVPAGSWLDIYKDYKANGSKFTYKLNMEMDSLKKYSRQGYPGWNLGIPDVVRAKIFLSDLAKMNTANPLPQLTIVYLPQDHTSGGSSGEPTPRACVADNDLALGQIVDGVSHSPFWKDTAIFVVEDDPQAGYDHIDGHRSPCLVISPYTKHGVVVSDFYNQTSVLASIENILGLPPMNRMDANSPLMKTCFQTSPDYTPYVVAPNQIPLDEMNGVSMNSPHLRFNRPDMNDDDAFNRILWRANHGPKPYPAKYAGAHGLGLAKKGLYLASGVKKDRD
jgi:DNA-binding beta-propeller fold protein YncE